MVQDHHKIEITLTRVLAGDKGSRCAEPSVFFSDIYPKDGIVIVTKTSGVTHTCYLPNSDIQAGLILKSGETMTAESWGTSPTPPKK